jgi:heme-degrading monooxygenase HmoA
MKAVITRFTVGAGAESEWEATMRERMSAAQASLGWIGGSILTPEDDRNARLILGLWDTRVDWERWHQPDAFPETAERLEGLERDAGEASWHEVVDARGQLRP